MLRRLWVLIAVLAWAPSVLAARPTGNLDEATGSMIRGWARDPDFAGAIDVHIYIDGRIAHATRAGDARPDLPFADKAHGFSWHPPRLGPGTHRINVYALGVTLAGAKNGENPELPSSPRQVTGSCAGATASDLAWCNGVASYYEGRGRDTDYLFNDAVRVGINRSFGGAIFELYGSDHAKNRLVQHGGAAIQLSVWGYDMVGPTGWTSNTEGCSGAACNVCSSVVYPTEAACQAGEPGRNCKPWAYTGGAHFATCGGPVKNCVPEWGPASPFNPIQAQAAGCGWEGATNDVTSASASNDAAVIRKTAPYHFTKSTPFPGLTWMQTATLLPAGVRLDYEIVYQGSYTLSPHPQEIPAIFPAAGINASFHYYTGSTPYTDAASGVVTSPTGGLLQLDGRGPYPHPQGAATITEGWVSACNAAGDECVTVAVFSDTFKEIDAKPSGPGGQEGYLTPIGGFDLHPGLNERFTAFVFPYRWDEVVAGQSIRQWIFAYHDDPAAVPSLPDPDTMPDPGMPSDPETEPDPTLEPDPVVDPGVDPQPGVEPEPVPDPGAETDPWSDPDAEPEPGPDPVVEPGNGDDRPPRVAFLVSNGTEVNGTSFLLRGWLVDDTGVARLEVDGQRVAFEGGYFAVHVDLELGINVVRAAAWDAAGNVGRARVELVRTPPGIGLSGIVVDALTGDPIRGAKIRFSDLVTVTYSDATGRFEQALEAGEWKAAVSRQGYRPRTFRFGLDDAVEGVRVKLEPVDAPPTTPADTTDPVPTGCGCAGLEAAGLALASLILARRRR